MELKGLLEENFRGVTIFRGYAPLRILANLSIPGDYQREQEKDRVSSIKNYMETSPFVFFPEIILGWQINDTSVIQRIKESENIGSLTGPDNIKFKKNTSGLRGIGEATGSLVKILTITVPDDLEKPLFNRIDGNHRLGVIDDMLSAKENSSLLDMIVPYSIIMQSANNESSKYEVAYFYLINSKSKPLTTDQNLKSIINTSLFSDIEKQHLLSLSPGQIRYTERIAGFLIDHNLEISNDIFRNHIFDLAVTLATQLIDAETDYSDEVFLNIAKSIRIVNSMYIREEIQNPQKDTILALIIRKYQQPATLNDFLAWINKNELGTITHLRFDKINQIFDALHKQRSYKVFVAMPYISHARVEEFNKLFKEVLKEISDKIGFGLSLIPIMRFKGEAERIDSRLIQKIKDCDIFIGDLTTCNDNVIFEVGLAEGCGKKILLIRAEEDTDKMPFDEVSKSDQNKIIPFDMDKLQYIPYPNSGYYNRIKGIMRNNLPVIIEQLRNQNV